MKFALGQSHLHYWMYDNECSILSHYNCQRTENENFYKKTEGKDECRKV